MKKEPTHKVAKTKQLLWWNVHLHANMHETIHAQIYVVLKNKKETEFQKLYSGNLESREAEVRQGGRRNAEGEDEEEHGL